MNHDRQRRADRWRSLSELAGAVDPDAALEFAPGVDEAPTVGRRDVGRLLGASLMLAGAAACTRAPKSRIVAYGKQPEQTPGVAETYATTMTLDGYGTGLLAQVHEGRPTKIEGNPDHPASLGGSGVFEQASLLSLYDPNRLRGVRHGRDTSSFTAFARALGRGLETRLDGVRLLFEETSSPQVLALVDRLEGRGAVAHVHDPLSRTNVWEGARLAFGQAAEPLYDLERADVIVALDSDFLADEPFHLRHARKFADRRRAPTSSGMNRLYVAEPFLTVTGSVADHRFRAKRGEVSGLAAALLAETLALLPERPAWAARVATFVGRAGESPDTKRWVTTVARDLVAHRGRVAVVVGRAQGAVVHALAALVNVSLSRDASPVRFVAPKVLGARMTSGGAWTPDIAALLDAVDQGQVHTVLMLGGNPSYTAPAHLEFSRRIRAVGERVYLSEYENETARDATWVLPQAHFLESWNDARARDGTVSFAQPMIEPLYAGRTPAEVLSVLEGERTPDGHELLLRHWRQARGGFDQEWAPALERGALTNTASGVLALAADGIGSELDAALAKANVVVAGLEVAFRSDSHARDGAFTNNAWLLELPDPITKLTWGNAACLSADTAARLGLSSEDVIELAVADRSVRAPVLIVPGHADECVSVSLGFGRDGDEELARGVGFNAYALRQQAAPWSVSGARLAKTKNHASFAITQEHGGMEGRPIALSGTLAELLTHPDRFTSKNRALPTLYQLKPNGSQQWAMTIDLNICTGCSACVVACQAENNVPIVGKAGVEKGRAMHWLRLDRYFEGDAASPDVHHQPMACQHCEKAPCEYVCPVGATVHSDDGLNEMVYNRCVGTRFCSNNCPYKVRRFNWFDYNRDKPETMRMAMNPDVTVRARGVMEKCTYCVQRIRENEIRGHREGVAYHDGDVRTACEQACPTKAITFGSITDPSSRVSVQRRDSRTYAVLHELGTEPRTRYLARIKNPNPEILT